MPLLRPFWRALPFIRQPSPCHPRVPPLLCLFLLPSNVEGQGCGFAPHGIGSQRLRTREGPHSDICPACFASGDACPRLTAPGWSTCRGRMPEGLGSVSRSRNTKLGFYPCGYEGDTPLLCVIVFLIYKTSTHTGHPSLVVSKTLTKSSSERQRPSLAQCPYLSPSLRDVRAGTLKEPCLLAFLYHPGLPG